MDLFQFKTMHFLGWNKKTKHLKINIFRCLNFILLFLEIQQLVRMSLFDILVWKKELPQTKYECYNFIKFYPFEFTKMNKILFFYWSSLGRKLWFWRTYFLISVPIDITTTWDSLIIILAKHKNNPKAKKK